MLVLIVPAIFLLILWVVYRKYRKEKINGRKRAVSIFIGLIVIGIGIPIYVIKTGNMLSVIVIVTFSLYMSIVLISEKIEKTEKELEALKKSRQT